MAKRRFDRLDAEAEREGAAIKRVGFNKPKIVGHRLQAMRRMTAAGNRIILTKIERRHV